MALGVVACRLPGRVERDGARGRAHGRAVPDAARARVLARVLGHGTLTAVRLGLGLGVRLGLGLGS